uniref:Uncharacterized protein n=1 Tax=Lankesteria abbotti TaxID=340204 RepID=A0A7S2QRR5_9APIC|mmetsp:Transcript_853/g.993  ORF Transcript_853/g.993 Transcript_853/m.993 type:complete len:113 (+) Transcript_853:425-763(+)
MCCLYKVVPAHQKELQGSAKTYVESTQDQPRSLHGIHFWVCIRGRVDDASEKSCCQKLQNDASILRSLFLYRLESRVHDALAEKSKIVSVDEATKSFSISKINLLDSRYFKL